LTLPKMERAPNPDPEFSRSLRAVVRNLDRCYQCSACSDGCPVAYAMDYHPNQIIHMVRLGLREEVLQSRAIWLCASCETCATRCPNEIDIVQLMDSLRQLSIREGFNASINEIPQFHSLFVEEIKRGGRINELRLVLRYKLRNGAFLSFKKVVDDARLGLRMFFKGRLRTFLPKVNQRREVKDIFSRTLGVKR